MAQLEAMVKAVPLRSDTAENFVVVGALNEAMLRHDCMFSLVHMLHFEAGWTDLFASVRFQSLNG